MRAAWNVRRVLVAAAGFGTGLVSSTNFFRQNNHVKTAGANPFKADKQTDNFFKFASRDKEMTLDEINALVEDGQIVVTYKGSVYDVTDFTGHPGGYGRLQMAAGNDLEAFWTLYTQHNRGHVVELLQRYRIGILSPEEAEISCKRTVFDNPYTNDPEPFPDLLINTRYPQNCEGRLRELGENWITPIGNHFVRNHGLVPDINPDEWELLVTGIGVKDTHFKLKDLKEKFNKVDIVTVIQCNGNRREDYHYLKEDQPAFGPPHWVSGAIGNSVWSGVRLRDVLKAAGMDVDGISLNKIKAPADAKHVGLLGADTDECGNQYCCSFPFEKAVDPFGDVILAYEMNGAPIPRHHGFPVRAIVPGHAGARNCKFVEKVTVTDNPCLDAGNWKQYAVHAPDVPLYKIQEFELHKKELKMDPAVQEMPVQSLITTPAAGDKICYDKVTGTIKVKGIAWGGGGEGVNRVDVSADGGHLFTRADMLEPEIPQRRKANWAWVFFEKNIVLPEKVQKQLNEGKAVDLELCSKALNTSWNVQPQNAEPNYNAHGCCVNHWYRVPVTVDPTIKTCQRAPEGEFANKPSGGKFKRPFRHLDPCPPVRPDCMGPGHTK